MIPARPPPDDDHAPRAHEPAPASARAATHAFSRVDSETRSRSTRSGSPSMRSQQAVVDPRHRPHAGGAAAVQQRHQLHPALEPLLRPVGLEAHQRAQLHRARRAEPLGAPPATGRAGERGQPRRQLGERESRRPGPKRRRSSRGQVHPAVLGVLAHVPQDVRELQRDAEVVGQRLGARRAVGGRPRAEDRQAHAADRPGHAAAVDDQLLEGLIARFAHVHAHALDQLLERTRGDLKARARVRQRDHHGVAAGAAPAPSSRSCASACCRRVAASARRGQLAVADVVDPAREGVGGAEGAAALGRPAGGCRSRSWPPARG